MRRSSLALILLAACAASGCTTVSAPPGPGPAPGSSAAASPAHRADDLTVRPQPGHAVLATAGPTAGPTASPRRSTAPPPRAHRSAPAPQTPPPRAERVRRAAPPPGVPSVCRLGETFGGWAAGGEAATICRQAYAR